MRANPRRMGRGSTKRVLSTISKLSKPGRSLETPRRVMSKARPSSSHRKSRSPRSIRKLVSPRSSIRRRDSTSPKRTSRRNSRNDIVVPKSSRDASNARTRSPDKSYHPKPSYEGPGKEISYSQEDLKKIRKEIWRDFSGESKQIVRGVIHPEEVTIIRRPGEGATPIFERPEIIQNKRNYDDYGVRSLSSDRLPYKPSTSYSNISRTVDYYNDKERDRSIITRRSPPSFDSKQRQREDHVYEPSRSTRRSRSFERFRDHHVERKDRYHAREDYRVSRRSLERERNSRRSFEKDVIPSRRSLERRDSRRSPEKSRDFRRSLERTRESRRSLERMREPRRSLERGRELRRSLERNRGRSDDRLTRRYPSPIDTRRRVDQYRGYDSKRTRSLEKREENSHRRDHHLYLNPESRFSNTSHSMKNRSGYYEGGIGRENLTVSTRGRGGGFFPHGRGGAISGRAFIRNPGSVIHPSSIRGMPIVRTPVMTRPVLFSPRKSFRGSFRTRH